MRVEIPWRGVDGATAAAAPPRSIVGVRHFSSKRVRRRRALATLGSACSTSIRSPRKPFQLSECNTFRADGLAAVG